MNKYYNYKAVGAYINDEFPSLTYDDYTLLRWVAWDSVKIHNGDSYFEENCLKKLDVKNGQAELPCDVYRVHTVLSCGEPIRYRIEGPFIRPYNLKEGRIEVTYDAIPLDENNLPRIEYNQIIPLAWSAIYRLYQQKFMDGEINESRMQFIEDRYQTEYKILLYDRKAFTNDDYEMLLWIQRNVIHRPGR
jgi:hypothetical protein